MEMHSAFNEQEASIESGDSMGSPWPLLPSRKNCAFRWPQLSLIVDVRANGSDMWKAPDTLLSPEI